MIMKSLFTAATNDIHSFICQAEDTCPVKERKIFFLSINYDFPEYLQVHAIRESSNHTGI